MKLRCFNLCSPTLIYVFFLLGYLIQISYLPVTNRLFKIIYFGLYGCGYLLGFFKLIKQHWNRNAFLYTCVMFLIAFAVFLYNTDIGMAARMTVLNIVWIILCSKGASFEKLLEIDVKIRVVFTVILALLCSIGRLENVTLLRNYSQVRYSFGYSHPNTLGSVLFLIAFYTMLLRRDVLKFFDLALQSILTLLIYRFTNSKTSVIGMIMIIIYTVFVLVSRHIKDSNRERILKGMKRILVIMPVVVTVLFFGLSLVYDSSNSKLAFFNKLLTSRLEQGSKILSYYSPTLFGSNTMRMSWQDVLEGGYNTALVGSDVSFIYIYSTYGIIVLLIYIYMLVKNLKVVYNLSFCYAYCMIVIIALSCVENQYVNVGSNAFLLFFQLTVYGSASNYAKFCMPLEHRSKIKLWRNVDGLTKI